MVYIKDNSTEEVTDAYMSTENGVECAVVETDDGYFIYKIPVVEAPDYATVNTTEVLDFATDDMKIIEAPEQENRTEFSGQSSLYVPTKVAEKAVEISGAEILE